MKIDQLPKKQGLYDPKFEHDACGIAMLAQIKGKKSHQMVCDGIEALNHLTHRGGVGSEEGTGDGAGIMIQIPHHFFDKICREQGVVLPKEGHYGVAMIFASPEQEQLKNSLKIFEESLKEENLSLLSIRKVPTNPLSIGKTAAEVCPSIYQVFIGKPEDMEEESFGRALYIVSKVSTNKIRYAKKGADPYFYLASCSSKTIVYKGMLLPEQLPAFYLDLLDQRVESAIVLVHSRFSTNTFPSWERAHPQRILIHNGEINTIRGNVNWMKARERSLRSSLFNEKLSEVLPIVDEDGSDSAMLDDFIRLLVNAGYSLPHAMAMAVPEPYENHDRMNEARRSFYEYHNCLSEPWDGPAALAFTDGVLCGAMLDRNGLRPARYTLTKDDRLILASEAGVLEIPDEQVLVRDRVRPGEMLLVDTKSGKILDDHTIKTALSSEKPYKEWLDKEMKTIDTIAVGNKSNRMLDLCNKANEKGGLDLSERKCLSLYGQGAFALSNNEGLSILEKEQMYGYTWEDLTLTLRGMTETKDDPVGAMGTDIPLAVLSKHPQLLYNYFKQLFAQVTNPPIDSLREKIVTSSSILLGKEGNLLEPDETACRFIKLKTPVLSVEEFEKLKSIEEGEFSSVTLPMVFSAQKGNLEIALQELFEAADFALKNGINILILSDQMANENYAPIPALLAVSGLHQHLIRKGTRGKCAIVAAVGDAWETQHIASLVSFGANAICPYMAYESLSELAEKKLLSVDRSTAVENYIYAATKSLVKIMSKMGISTVRSYQGAQVFEALGINQQVVDTYFTGTTTRIGGLGIKEIESEILERHGKAFSKVKTEALPAGGAYKWRKSGEYHLFNPENVFYLQQACRTGEYDLFKTYSEAVNKRSEQLKNIRGLLQIRLAEKPISLESVESEESIIHRFKTGAMSYGSISAEAHECMAVAMNRLGGKSNTGEGGENPDRFLSEGTDENRCSAIKQVASGRFGVTIEYLNHAKEIQIKMAQGAKPGEGGHLPGGKVYPWIAKSRHATPGVELISPPPHHDIYSIEDLAQLIHDLKNANPQARISVKLVSEAGVGTIAVGVAKGLADVIVVSGYDGGTGAAPRTSIRHAGLPWELGIAEAHQTLLLNGLRNRVTLETDGKLLTGRDVVIAALLGAEEFAFATAPLIAMGCDMMRVCNLDTCPVGVATQNPELRKRFSGKPEHIENLMRFMAREVREWMSKIGVHTLNELVGHTEFLKQASTNFSEKAKTVDLSALLYQPKISDNAKERYFTMPQEHHLEKFMDEAVLIPLCCPAIEEEKAVEYELPINNQDRTVGCRLSGEITKKHGRKGLAEDQICLTFKGSAGQSFGAFATNGMALRLLGETNDYLAKGLCGGKIILSPPEDLSETADEHIIAGNVAFFGATAGEGYVCGQAGERFSVRNSGAKVVVEGIGDHGCEYMTGGTVLILGKIGQNFAAGMSGGVAYLYDPEKKVSHHCNLEKATLYELTHNDMEEIKKLMEKHLKYTGSHKAKMLLENFEIEKSNFKKLVPDAYKKAMDALEKAKKEELSEEDQLLAAFHAVTA